MSEEKEQFQSSNICWICEKPVDDDDEKARDHCYITWKFRGAAHWSCNLNLQLAKKVLAIFHNLRGYGSQLIFNELNKFDGKIDVIRNRLENYMAFFWTKAWSLLTVCNLWILEFLTDDDFKYLIEEFGSRNLELLKQKEAYPYEYMGSFKRFNKEKLSDKKCF